MTSGSSSTIPGGSSAHPARTISPHILIPATATGMQAGTATSVSTLTSVLEDSVFLGAFSFSPPMNPWSTNDERSLNRFDRNELVQHWKTATKLFYGQSIARVRGKKALPPAVVHVTIPFRVDRRRDPHNYCGTVVKAIVDGLVLGGAWPDDTPEFVGHLEPTLYVGKHVWVDLFLGARYVLVGEEWQVVP